MGMAFPARRASFGHAKNRDKEKHTNKPKPFMSILSLWASQLETIFFTTLKPQQTNPILIFGCLILFLPLFFLYLFLSYFPRNSQNAVVWWREIDVAGGLASGEEQSKSVVVWEREMEIKMEMEMTGGLASGEAQISIVTSSMFPGFRFSPTDEELISYYLKKKIEGAQNCVEIISEIEIWKYEPWDLPGFPLFLFLQIPLLG